MFTGEEKTEFNQVSRFAMSTAAKWWLFLLVLGALSSAISLALKPTWLGFERKIFKASHQYREAHEEQLLRLHEKKAELAAQLSATEESRMRTALSGQIAAIETRIRFEESRLEQ